MGHAVVCLSLAGAVLLAAIPPMANLKVFFAWDLTFGSGMQTFGALLAALTFGWCVKRGHALRELAVEGRVATWLYWWIRLGIPAAILSVGVWWVVTEVL